MRKSMREKIAERVKQRQLDRKNKNKTEYGDEIEWNKDYKPLHPDNK